MIDFLFHNIEYKFFIFKVNDKENIVNGRNTFHQALNKFKSQK